MSLHARKTYSSRDVAPEAHEEQPVGYLIDERGREIPITEDMIQQACETLHRHWAPPAIEVRSGAPR
ncbi:PA1571 family protein [Halopseudomonas nanhaiensis]|uniref:PA1571 family protein n=1 Tax=Halopseudomonas nanhaiensis TaxID=2830842 RepID=UPI00311AAFD4